MSKQRQVTVQRLSPGRFAAVNQRGGTVSFGRGEDADFTPTELLLAAIGGCTAIDVDILTSAAPNRLRSRSSSAPTRSATTTATTSPTSRSRSTSRSPRAIRRRRP